MYLAVGLAAQAGADSLSDLDAAWQRYNATRDSDDAVARVEAARAVLELGSTALPARDRRRPILLLNYAEALNAAGRPREARKIAKQALKLAESMHGRLALEIVDYWMTLGDVQGSLESAHFQGLAYRHALRLVGEHKGTNSIDYADRALYAGYRLYHDNGSAKARRWLKAAQSVYSSSLDEGDPRFATTALLLGRLEYQLGKVSSAARHLETGLTAAISGGAELSGVEIELRSALVELLERQGKSSEATEHCVAIGRLSSGGEIDELPLLYEARPAYSSEMANTIARVRVDVEFTVDPSGFVRDPRVVDFVHFTTDVAHNRVRVAVASSWMEDPDIEAVKSAALEAITRFRFAPKFADGHPVATAGVTHRFDFSIDGLRFERYR